MSDAQFPRPLTPPYVRFRIRRFQSERFCSASSRSGKPVREYRRSVSGKPVSSGRHRRSTMVPNRLTCGTMPSSDFRNPVRSVSGASPVRGSDFAYFGPLVHGPRLISTSCSSGQCFAAASFGFLLAADTLAGRCDVPPDGPSRDFHPLVVRPAGRTKKNRPSHFTTGGSISNAPGFLPKRFPYRSIGISDGRRRSRCGADALHGDGPR